jgi:hypothetical protein
MRSLIIDQQDERDAVPEQFFEAAVGAINGTALSVALFTAAAVLMRRPDILFCSVPLNVIEVLALILLGFGSFGLNIWVFCNRLSRLAIGWGRRVLLSGILVAVLVPLAIALVLGALAQLPNLSPQLALLPTCLASGEPGG